MTQWAIWDHCIWFLAYPITLQMRYIMPCKQCTTARLMILDNNSTANMRKYTLFLDLGHLWPNGIWHYRPIGSYVTHNCSKSKFQYKLHGKHMSAQLREQFVFVFKQTVNANRAETILQAIYHCTHWVTGGSNQCFSLKGCVKKRFLFTTCTVYDDIWPIMINCFN